jgi:hypothetical protein
MRKDMKTKNCLAASAFALSAMLLALSWNGFEALHPGRPGDTLVRAAAVIPAPSFSALLGAAKNEEKPERDGLMP